MRRAIRLKRNMKSEYNQAKEEVQEGKCSQELLSSSNVSKKKKEWLLFDIFVH